MCFFFDSQKNMSSEKQSSLQIIQSLHLDFIHDVAFDHYGRRIATCSGDRTVKVWDLNEKGEWTFQPGSGSDWQAHRGSVTRLSWAHPEFGQLLATCGADHVATIWEERDASFSFPVDEHYGGGNLNTMNGQDGTAAASRWVSKAELTDARKAVTCIQFAPRHLGLKIATGSADGFVRIYEAIDVMNLTHWPINGSIEAESTADSSLGVTSLSWCGGRFEPPTLVVGGSSSKVSVYSYNNESRKWHVVVELPGHAMGVHDVAWAPNIGRSFHLIATAGTDNTLKVHRLKRKWIGSSSTSSSSSSSSTSNTKKNKTKSNIDGAALELESTKNLDTERTEVWRCSWNVTGTVLASSADGGIVQLWKCDFRDNSWNCVSKVQGNAQSP